MTLRRPCSGFPRSAGPGHRPGSAGAAAARAAPVGLADAQVREGHRPLPARHRAGALHAAHRGRGVSGYPCERTDNVWLSRVLCDKCGQWLTEF